MDSLVLRCNIIRCRAHLEHRAVVTTCSHIFCAACAEGHGLLTNSSSNNSSHRPSTSNTHHTNQRACPACRSSLVAPDDAVFTTLNPTDDYKTSLLSGLNPGLIMEIAGRGLAFWGYQAMQEVLFQETFSRNLNDKYTSLNSQLDKLVHDANTEISNLRKRLEVVTLEREGVERKCLELGEAFREKSRKCLQFQDLYDKLKRKMLLANVQNAANETAEHLVMSGVGMAGQEGAHGGGGGGGAGAGGVGGDGMRQIRFSGGGMNNPITIDEVSGNMGGLRMAGGGGGGVGGNQSTGQGRNSSFGMRGSNNTGGAGMNNMRAGGPNGSGRNNGNNGMYMDIDTTPCPTPRHQPGGGLGAGGGRGMNGMNMNMTQSTPHRQRLIPTPVNGQQQFLRENDNFFSFGDQYSGGMEGMDRRQPLGGLNENNLGMGGRYVGGLSAGVRIGRPQGQQVGGGLAGGMISGRGGGVGSKH